MGINLLRFNKKKKKKTKPSSSGTSYEDSKGGKSGISHNKTNNNKTNNNNNNKKAHVIKKDSTSTNKTDMTATSGAANNANNNNNNNNSNNPKQQQKMLMDVPVNINVEKRDRRVRGMTKMKNDPTQFSTFSLLSMPSFQREEMGGENPYLWEYDQDVYTSYDVNQEIQQQQPERTEAEDDDVDDEETKIYLDEEEHHHRPHPEDDAGVEEEDHPFFAANPLPGIVSTPYQHQHPAPAPAPPPRRNSGREIKKQQQQQQPPQQPRMSKTRTTTTTTTITDLPAGDPTYAKPDVTRDLVKKFISDIWNRGDVHLIPQVCSPKIRFNGTGETLSKVGHDGFANMVQEIHQAFRDYHCEIHSMVVEGNKAFCRLRFSGRHVGRLMGYPPTGQLMYWSGATEFTCVNGLILKVWEIADIRTLLDQLEEENYKLSFEEDVGWGN